jgi:DNA-binding MarR family transcriptional regulator
MQVLAPDDVRVISQALADVLRRGNLPRVQDYLLDQAGLKVDRTTYWLLRHLGDQEPLRLSDLAARQGTDISTVCRQVNKCEALGLVAREGDPSDLRAVLLRLTDQGRDVLQRMQRVRLDLLDRVLADWNDGDRHDFARLVERFAADYLKNTGAH